MKLYAFFLLWLCVFPNVQGQVSIVKKDSLRHELQLNSNDTNRVNQLLALSRQYIFRPGLLKADVDSASLLIQQAATLSKALTYTKGQGDVYFATAQILREKKQFALGKEYASKAIDVLTKAGYPNIVGYIYIELNYYYSYYGYDLSLKIQQFEKALFFFRQAGNRRNQADMLKELGDLYQIQENYTQSLFCLRQALVLYQSIEHPDLQGTYDLLGFVSTKIGDFKEGLMYGLKAVKTAHLRNDQSLQLCTIYNRVGNTYRAISQFDQAYNYFQKSIDIAQRHNDNASVMYLAGNISSLLLQMSKPDKALTFLQIIAKKYPQKEVEGRLIVAVSLMGIHEYTKQHSLAQQYCDLALDLDKKNGSGSLGKSIVYQSVIRFYIASKQYDQAKALLEINEKLNIRNRSAVGLLTNQLLWFKLDSTQANYQSAIGHYQQFKALQDSLINESNSRQIALLQIQFDTEKKEQNIKYLQQKSKLQEATIDKSYTTRNAIIALSIMLTLLLRLSYNRYRLKQQSNQQLEAKQELISQKNDSLQKLVKEKEWLLKEIHHRVKNNLHTITSLLESQSAYLQDDALAAIRDSQHRVFAMSLIHQKLYPSENLAAINMAPYLHELVGYLRDSFNTSSHIRFELDVAPIELEVSQAVPLGLILNEIITNAIKYAFPGGKSGRIEIVMRQVSAEEVELSVADNGIGLPTGFDSTQSSSLGMRLMNGLSEEIGAQLRIESEQGTKIVVRFNIDRLLDNLQLATIHDNPTILI